MNPDLFNFGDLFFDERALRFLIYRLVINMISISIMINGIYYRVNKRQGRFFSLYIFNIIVFFVASVLGKASIQSGFAFGLFAIFSILRYRTRQISIREMTFLFVAVMMAIINSPLTGVVSFVELIFVNIVILIICFLDSRIWVKDHYSTRTLVYEKVKLLAPGKKEKLLEDLRSLTGLYVVSVEIGKVNYQKKTSEITVFYDEEKSVEMNREEEPPPTPPQKEDSP